MSSPADNVQSQLDKLCPSLHQKLIKLACFVVWGVAALLFGIFILVLCLTRSPDNAVCHVSNATWLTDSNLTIAIIVRNPNGFYHVQHDNVKFTAYYQNQTSDSVLDSFSQGHDKETRLTPSFNGLQITCGGNDLHCRDGYYDVLIKLNMLDVYKKQILPRKRFLRNLDYTCKLKVPSSSGSSFNTTLCLYRQISKP